MDEGTKGLYLLRSLNRLHKEVGRTEDMKVDKILTAGTSSWGSAMEVSTLDVSSTTGTVASVADIMIRG